jgi:hypothetical protein
MKHPEGFSDEAVLRRSQEATRALEVARRSAAAKRMLDRAAARKAKGTLKEFADLRFELTEGEELEEHVAIAHSSMPPNILILKRKTVRQFPNQTMVALYYNDKLDQFFSIPYGGEAQSIVNPVALAKEEKNTYTKYADRSPAAKKRYRDALQNTTGPGSDADIAKYKAEKAAQEKAKVTEEVVQENAISHLKKVVAFKTSTPLNHKDGTKTRIDPTTASALLTVHGALHPDNQKKFADALEHSKPHFARMLDFAWKQVK